MISFFLNGYRFLKILFKGLKNDGEFRFLFIFIVLLIIGSTAFYIETEHWSVIDALYFSVTTMATVGYGDLVPKTDVGKVFTMIYVFLSIGAFVSFTAKCVQITLLSHQNKKNNKSQKAEEKKKNNCEPNED